MSGKKMSDDERALIGARHRAPALGVPVGEFDKNQFTPVTEVIARIERVINLDERDRILIHLFWEHTANMTMRWANTDAAAIDGRLDALELAIVDIRGQAGTNGKIGALKARVDQAESRRWWAVTFIAGLIVTIIGSAIAFGTWKGSIQADVDALKQHSLQKETP